MKPLKFSFFEKFASLRNQLKKCRKTTKNEKIFDIGVSKVNHERDVINILQQFKKMKAVIDVMM